MVGMFANQKMALIQTESGHDVTFNVIAAVDAFPNAKFILSVGICYAFDKKIKIGDVLVSNEVASFKLLSNQEGPVVE